MIRKILSLLNNKEKIAYLFFGVLTTAVNVISFTASVKLFHIYYLESTILAWFISVMFAYVTNKFWVFESKHEKIHVEIGLFMGGRIFSGVVDLGLMYIFISILSFNAQILGFSVAKMITQVIVFVLNFVLNKGVVFR
ncbi:MAG: GtrA family protein [Methanobrevibacter sp.]|jgi:putative flippase GtrA|nr:GtrA family protein [Candidatus Methanovirga basalitermitum]